MKNRTLITLGLPVAAVAVYFGMRAYTAKMPVASGHVPEFSLQADELYKAFQEDEMKAGAQYNDKLIEVKGAVKEVSTAGDGRMSVQLGSGTDFGAVVCEFPEKAKEPAKGDQVVIKGYCAGFNFDVLLQRCTFTGKTGNSTDQGQP